MCHCRTSINKHLVRNVEFHVLFELGVQKRKNICFISCLHKYRIYTIFSKIYVYEN